MVKIADDVDGLRAGRVTEEIDRPERIVSGMALTGR